MQTFLPYPSFKASAICLDKKRLNKQIVEGHQILRTLEGYTSGWSNHPVMKMWRGYESALRTYVRIMGEEAVQRGMKCSLLALYTYHPDLGRYPPWLGDEAFHASHRSNLIRKDPIWYCQFGWKEDPYLPYVWPEATNGTA